MAADGAGIIHVLVMSLSGDEMLESGEMSRDESLAIVSAIMTLGEFEVDD